MNKYFRELDGKTDVEIINFLLSKGLLRDSPLCVHCPEPKGVMIMKMTRDSKDCYNWRCMNYNCPKYQTTSSLRIGSWFEKHKMSFKQALRFIFMFSQGLQQQQLSISCGVSLRTIKRLCSELQLRIENYFEWYSFRMGGPGTVVQVDETMLNHKVKSHRGHAPVQQTWALCLVDTTTTPATGWVEIVPNRTKSTLLNVITRVVREGTEIHTDEWRGYDDLHIHDFTHRKVTHKYHFVDPETRIHTQHVESYNNKIKAKIKKEKGVMSIKRVGFLKRFMFFDLNKERILEAVIDLLKVV